jgi:RNA polymerase sigma-70 factor (ECF subfamily)
MESSDDTLAVAWPTVSPVKIRTHPGRQLGPASEQVLRSERELITKVLAGDRVAAVLLHRTLLPVVVRTLRRVIGRRDSDHDDLLQQSFEQIVRTLRQRRFDHACPLSAWATTITARVALTELRRRYLRRRHIDVAAAPPEHCADDVQSWELKQRIEERCVEVRRALAAMDPGRAWVVVLHDLEGHRIADVAHMLEISVTAAQSRLLRARKELVRRCGPSAERGPDHGTGGAEP